MQKDRGTGRARLTRMEKHWQIGGERGINTLGRGKKIRRLKELAKEHDGEFEERHVEVLNLIAAEDTAALQSEEALFEEHVDRERLEQLEDLI